jgi:hypothetical protein
MISSLLLFVAFANAQDFMQVQKGQPAPFTGTLLTPESVATIVAKHDSDVAMCVAESDHKLQEQEIKCELQVQKTEYDFSSYKMTSEELMQQKDKELDRAYELLKERSKNQTPLWLGVGFVGGLATSIGMYYLYEEINQ